MIRVKIVWDIHVHLDYCLYRQFSQTVNYLNGREKWQNSPLLSLSLLLNHRVTRMECVCTWEEITMEPFLSLLKWKEGLAVPIRPRNFPIWLTQTIFGGCRHIAKLSPLPSLSRTYFLPRCSMVSLMENKHTVKSSQSLRPCWETGGGYEKERQYSLR